MGTSRRAQPSVPRLLIFLLGTFLFFSTFSIAGTHIALAVTVSCWIILSLAGKAPRLKGTKLDHAVFIFLAAHIVAVIFSKQKLESFINMKNLLLLCIIYLIALLVQEWKVSRKLFGVLFLSCTASSIYGIAVFLLHQGEGTLGRTPGSFSTAMTFGGVLLILCSLFFSIGVGYGLTRKSRLIILSGVIIAAVALFFTFTRGSWLGMLASVLIIVAIQRRKWVLPSVAVLVVLTVILPTPYRNRITSIWDPHYRTNVQRLELLTGGWRIFRDHPVVGVGPIDLAEVYERYKPSGAVFIHGHMHNIFLQYAVTMGIVGLVAFCYLVFSFFRLMMDNLRIDLPPPERAWVVGTIGALTGFLVNGLFEWNFGDAEVVTLLYVVVGSNLAIATNRNGFIWGRKSIRSEPVTTGSSEVNLCVPCSER